MPDFETEGKYSWHLIQHGDTGERAVAQAASYVLSLDDGWTPVEDVTDQMDAMAEELATELEARASVVVGQSELDRLLIQGVAGVIRTQILEA